MTNLSQYTMYHKKYIGKNTHDLHVSACYKIKRKIPNIEILKTECMLSIFPFGVCNYIKNIHHVNTEKQNFQN